MPDPRSVITERSLRDGIGSPVYRDGNAAFKEKEEGGGLSASRRCERFKFLAMTGEIL